MEQLSHHPPVTAFHMIGAGILIPFPYNTKSLSSFTVMSSLIVSISRTGDVFAEELITYHPICSLAVPARVLI